MTRKRLWFYLCALWLFGIAQPAAAQTPSPVPLAGYDDGFFLRSADDAFRLQIASLLQFQYRYHDFRTALTADDATFRMLRARLHLLATVWEHFEFTLLASHTTGEAAPDPTFWQAEMTALITPAFNITAGTITVPLDRQGEGSPATLAFIEEPITATQADGVSDHTIARQSFGNPATLGIRLWGDVGRFHYIVGVANGDDFTALNQTTQLAYGTRLWIDVLGETENTETDLDYSETPQLAFGVGTTFDHQNATDANINLVDLDWSWIGSGDILFKWRGLTILSEAYFRRLQVATGNFTLDDVGYYAQAGYFVLPKRLEVVGRAAQIFREGPDNNAYEFAAGVNWYIKDNNIKWQFDAARLLDYDATIGTGGATTYRYRTQLSFNI